MNTFLNMGVNVCNMKVWLHEQLCGYMWVNMCESVCVCDRCVCVCPPLDKGFRPTNPLVTFATVQFQGFSTAPLQFFNHLFQPPSTGRGVWPSCPTTRNEAVDKKGKQGLIIPVYLLINTLTPMVHPAAVRWFHGFLHDTLPQTGFSHSRFSAAVRRSSVAVASLQMRINFLLKHLQLIGLLTLPFSHLPSQRGN